MSDQNLGKFSEGFASLRAMMAGCAQDKRITTFGNICREAASYCSHGLDRTICADELFEIAASHGIEDADAVQLIVSGAFQKIEDFDRVPDDLEERTYTNGHAKKSKEPELPNIVVLSAFPIDEKTIPVREWLVPGLFARKQITVLVAPSGSGKSLLTLQIGMACALKMEWAGWRPRGQFRVLIINSEDDTNELRRRLAAAVHVMAPDQDELKERFFLTEADHVIIAKFDARSKTLVRTPMLAAVSKIVADNQIDLVIVDPFAETFEGDENSNSELKWAGMWWREVARKTNCALCLVHHTKKYASGMAGDVDAARGAGALIGIARLVSTLFPMTATEAKTMDVKEGDRGQYLRYDDAKANLNLKSPFARWFRKQTITLDNATADLPGDEVGALVPWKPEGLWEGTTQDTIDKLMGLVDLGVTTKDGRWIDYFTMSKTTSDPGRWVGTFIASHLNCSADRAKNMIEAWRESGLLVDFQYRSPTRRKIVRGCGSKQLAEQVNARAAAETDQKVLPLTAVRVVGDCDEQTLCVACQQIGNVKRIRNGRRPGSKAETLHEGCAEDWFKRTE